MYSNADGLLNKKDELRNTIEKDKPLIIALREIKPKRQYDFNTAEYNIAGDTLNNSYFEESAWCQINTLNKTKVLLGCTYSPNTIEQNGKILFSLLELTNKSISNNGKIYIMGDINYLSIKWNGI